MKLASCFLTLLLASHSGAPFVAGHQTKSHANTCVVDSLPPPNDLEIRKVESADEWNNPYVIVYADGYELLRQDHDRDDAHLTLKELETTLLSLPAKRWRLGKVVAVQEIGPRSVGDNMKITSRVRSIQRMLESYKLRVDLWPSS